jgi:hypothetical protein
MSEKQMNLDDLIEYLNEIGCSWKSKTEELIMFAEKLEFENNRLQAQILKMRNCTNCRYRAVDWPNCIDKCSKSLELWEPIP